MQDMKLGSELLVDGITTFSCSKLCDYSECFTFIVFAYDGVEKDFPPTTSTPSSTTSTPASSALRLPLHSRHKSCHCFQTWTASTLQPTMSNTNFVPPIPEPSLCREEYCWSCRYCCFCWDKFQQTILPLSMPPAENSSNTARLLHQHPHHPFLICSWQICTSWIWPLLLIRPW